MFFLETTKITNVSIIISVLGLPYLTDPIHSAKRYGNHNGFRDLSFFMGPAGVCWKDPGSIRIPSSSWNNLGIIGESFGIWLGWMGWLGGAEFFESPTKTNIKSTR